MSAISKPILRIKLVIILFKLLLCLYQRTPLMIYNYLSQCWPRSMSPCGVTIPQAVKFHPHYSHVIMSAMASQITAVTIVYSIVCWGADKKTSKLRVAGLCEGNSPVTSKFSSQRASNAENVSIWWRHHEIDLLLMEWTGMYPITFLTSCFFLNLVGFNQLFVIPHDLSSFVARLLYLKGFIVDMNTIGKI